MNKDDVGCIVFVLLLIGGMVIAISYFGEIDKENYYKVNISTDNKVFFQTGNRNFGGGIAWQGVWWDLPYNQSYHKTTDYGIKFKEYVYTNGTYEIVYSNNYWFNYESLLANDGIACIILENATITISII